MWIFQFDFWPSFMRKRNSFNCVAEWCGLSFANNMASYLSMHVINTQTATLEKIFSSTQATYGKYCRSHYMQYSKYGTSTLRFLPQIFFTQGKILLLRQKYNFLWSKKCGWKRIMHLHTFLLNSLAPWYRPKVFQTISRPPRFYLQNTKSSEVFYYFFLYSTIFKVNCLVIVRQSVALIHWGEKERTVQSRFSSQKWLKVVFQICPGIAVYILIVPHSPTPLFSLQFAVLAETS